MHEKMNRFTGAGPKATPAPELPAPVLGPHRREDAYIAQEQLRTAVNVALALGQPLLLGGPPGSGKTALAYAVAGEFGLEIEKIPVRSTTTGADLFYRFDHLARFRDAQRGGAAAARPMQSYLSFVGLGLAILRAAGPEAELEWREGNPVALDHAEAPEIAPVPPRTLRGLLPDEYTWTDPVSTVVLIDELDKAPRDTPNDVLGWLETMSFEIEELGVTVSLPPDARRRDGAARPIVIMTTNSEQQLPDAFLRRCVYHEIRMPEGEELIEILARRFDEDLARGRLTSDALEILGVLRRPEARLERPPGTAERLAMIGLLTTHWGLSPASSLREAPEAVEAALGVIVKTAGDLAAARRALTDWLPPEARRG